jgi:hypothetical protein
MIQIEMKTLKTVQNNLMLLVRNNDADFDLSFLSLYDDFMQVNHGAMDKL